MKREIDGMGGKSMREKEMPFFLGYSGMGNGRGDYDAFYGVTPRMQNWGSHCHDFYEFYIHFNGGRQMAYDNQFYDLVPYQLFIFPPFSMHGLVCLEEAVNYERAFLYASVETLKRAGCGQIDLDYVFRTELSNKGNTFPMSQQDAEKCRAYIQTILTNQALDTQEARFENYAMILSFLNCVLKAVHEKEAETPSLTVPTTMQRIISYINEHYREQIKLKDISEHFNISQSALSHYFVRYTNRGVYDYILFRRIVLARQMILSGEPLSDVSDQCGFTDYSNFLRIFRKQMGMSPRAYRDQAFAKRASDR
jgi:AraC-like DNA-binding protein